MIELIKLDETSMVPKYLQIINSIIHNITVGNARIGDKVPSINKLSEEFYLSRDTVERAYNVLKEKQVIVSVHGKGTYVAKTQLNAKRNVLFLINRLSPYKLQTYNAFFETLGKNYHVDFHSYHSDETLFLELFHKNDSNYDYFVMAPHFRTDNLLHANFTEKVNDFLGKIPEEKLIFLDNRNALGGRYIEVYQDFENDIFNALTSGLGKISKYRTLNLVYPKASFYPHPKGIVDGFSKFCLLHDFNFNIIDEVDQDITLQKEELYITIEEDDLVNLVNRMKVFGYELGKDLGVISYNDTPLKQLLGITVISTNFEGMGRKAAEMILNNEREQVKNDFDYIDRTSV
jgi:DNA-binding transcriptional regulator YhcF (GntR family)